MRKCVGSQVSDVAHGPLVIISLENLPIATCQMQPRKDIGSCLKFKVLLKEKDLIIPNLHNQEWFYNYEWKIWWAELISFVMKVILVAISLII